MYTIKAWARKNKGHSRSIYAMPTINLSSSSTTPHAGKLTVYRFNVCQYKDLLSLHIASHSNKSCLHLYNNHNLTHSHHDPDIYSQNRTKTQCI